MENNLHSWELMKHLEEGGIIISKITNLQLKLIEGKLQVKRFSNDSWELLNSPISTLIKDSHNFFILQNPTTFEALNSILSKDGFQIKEIQETQLKITSLGSFLNTPYYDTLCFNSTHIQVGYSNHTSITGSLCGNFKIRHLTSQSGALTLIIYF